MDYHSPEFKAQVQRLCQRCESILLGSKNALTEHQMIQQLVGAGAFNFLGSPKAAVLLFYKHFLTMHCLYQLQPKFFAKNRLLTVSPLAIKLTALELDSLELEKLADKGAQPEGGLPLSHFDGALSQYYGDLSRLEAVTEATVADLLGQFWNTFSSEGEVPSACDILGVAKTADWACIQAAYRKKIARAHPDKGGDAESFIKIQQAFELLKQRSQP